MAASGQATARADSRDPGSVRAPLFQKLIARIESGGRWVVLDLGPPRSATIELLSSFRCRLEIADMTRRLEQLDRDPATIDPARRVQSLLPRTGTDRTDIVLCWDLFNYLQPPAIVALMNALGHRSNTRVLVHAMIYYSSPGMPARPTCWDPDGPGHLLMESHSGQERPAPRYAPKSLLKFMPGWKVEQAMLLGNGMQEYLLRLDPGATSPTG